MPRAVAVVQSHLATQWIILVNLLILARLFFGSEVATDAMRCSGSVGTVIAGRGIAAHSAASGHVGSSDGVPIAVISRALKDVQIIATGSVNTGADVGESESA
jgi:hypothetical protein